MLRRLGILIILLTVLTGVAAISAQDGQSAWVRVAHNAEGVGAVDVFVNGELSALQGVGFGETTDYVEVPAGAYRFAVGEAGSGEADLNISTRLAAGSYYTISADVVDGRPRLSRSEDVALIRVYHNAEGVGEVDVYVNGALTDLQGVPFGALSDLVSLTPGAYQFGVGAAGSGSPDLLTLDTELAPDSRSVIMASFDASGAPVLSAIPDAARVRAYHNANGVGAVDVFVDGERSGLQGIEFGTFSDYATLPSGVYQFGAAEAGSDSADFTITARLLPMTDTTIVATLNSTGEFVQLSREVRTQPAPGPAFVRVAHNAENFGEVDVYVNGALTELQAVPFGVTSGLIELAPGTYRFGVGEAGSGSPEFTITTNLAADSYTLISAVPAGGAVRLVRSNDVAYVRVIHAANGVPAVDVLIDDVTSDIRGLEFGEATSWVAVTPGAYRFAVALAGTTESENTLSRNLQPGSWTTIIAGLTNDSESVRLRALNEQIGGLDASRARVTVIHAIPGYFPVNVQLDNGTVLIQNLAFPGALGDNDGADTIEVAPGTYTLQVTPNGLPENVVLFYNGTLLGGTDYLFIAYGDPGQLNLLVRPTSGDELR